MLLQLHTKKYYKYTHLLPLTSALRLAKPALRLRFLQDLGRGISQVSGDAREASYLFQRIAVTTKLRSVLRLFRCK